jgi:cytochrome c biogenesis factor
MVRMSEVINIGEGLNVEVIRASKPFYLNLWFWFLIIIFLFLLILIIYVKRRRKKNEKENIVSDTINPSDNAVSQ